MRELDSADRVNGLVIGVLSMIALLVLPSQPFCLSFLTLLLPLFEPSCIECSLEVLLRFKISYIQAEGIQIFCTSVMVLLLSSDPYYTGSWEKSNAVRRKPPVCQGRPSPHQKTAQMGRLSLLPFSSDRAMVTAVDRSEKREEGPRWRAHSVGAARTPCR